MPTTAEQIDAMLEERNLDFFKRGDDAWIIPYATFFVAIRLYENGEFIWFHGSVFADLETLSPIERQRALRHFMELNDQIKLGRYCGYPKVNFEIGLPIEDGVLTSDQFHLCLGVTTSTTAEERYVPTPSFADFNAEPFLLTETRRLPPEETPPDSN